VSQLAEEVLEQLLAMAPKYVEQYQ
jgi:hypothetical protein